MHSPVNKSIMPLTFSNGITTPPVNTNTFQPSAGLPANGSPYVVVAVGDGASGETGALAVSNLMELTIPIWFSTWVMSMKKEQHWNLLTGMEAKRMTLALSNQ